MISPKPWRENKPSFDLSLLSLFAFHPTETEKIEKDYYGKVVNYNGTKAIVKTCDKNSSEPYKMVSINAIDCPLDSQINQYKIECAKLQGLLPQPTIVPVSGGTRHRKRSKRSKRTKKQRKHWK